MRMKKSEDIQASIITALANMFDIILTCNVRLVQTSFYNGKSFY